jgi:archaellum component FlaC
LPQNITVDLKMTMPPLLQSLVRQVVENQNSGPTEKMLKEVCDMVQGLGRQIADLAKWAMEGEPLIKRHQGWEPELLRMQEKVSAVQEALKQVGPALGALQTLVSNSQGAVQELQKGLMGTQKNLEGVHRQVADMYGDVVRQKTTGDGLGSKLAQLEQSVQELRDLHKRAGAAQGGPPRNEVSVLGTLTGVEEAKQMCRELGDELKKFAEASEARLTRLKGEPSGLTAQQVGEICQMVWNSKVEELEQRLKKDIAQEFSGYVTQRKWNEEKVGFVPWDVFKQENRAVSTRCDVMEASMKAWEAEEWDPPQENTGMPQGHERSPSVGFSTGSVTPVFVNEPGSEAPRKGRNSVEFSEEVQVRHVPRTELECDNVQGTRALGNVEGGPPLQEWTSRIWQVSLGSRTRGSQARQVPAWVRLGMARHKILLGFMRPLWIN